MTPPTTTPAAETLDRDALIALIMEETTDDIVTDGWDNLGKPNVLVQGCRYVRRNAPSSPEGYANPEEAAKRFAGFIADRVLAALSSHPAPALSVDLEELKRLAEAATPGDLDTVLNPRSEYGGHSTGIYPCPACQGDGEVSGETYCNFDGVALGVQFFGIGNEFKNYEAYFRVANPQTILSLIAHIERGGGR